MYDYETGYGKGNEHDKIQRRLKKELQEYSKRHLSGISWPKKKRHEQAYRDDSVVKTEKRISGDLPSGKNYCRIDVMLRIGDTSYAFEIKTNASDATNWPEQEADYRSQGYVPIIITTPGVVVDLAPGHRLVTDSEHGYASDYSIYLQSDRLPQTLINHFSVGSPIDPPRDRCPDCGFKLEYKQFPEAIFHRCTACGWDENRHASSD